MEKTIDRNDYNFAFLDEGSKREIRRSILHAIAIPGYQVPFGSRELPIGRGWGTGGIQLTMSLIGPQDTLKVIDQGNDDSVNAGEYQAADLCHYRSSDYHRYSPGGHHPVPPPHSGGAPEGGPGAGAAGSPAGAPAQRGRPRRGDAPASCRRGIYRYLGESV